jgi:RNA polymerase sigma-B factor
MIAMTEFECRGDEAFARRAVNQKDALTPPLMREQAEASGSTSILVMPDRASERDEVCRLLEEYAAHRDPMVRDRLVDLNGDLVHYIARRFVHRGEPLEDIVQAGYVGLIKAIERFDPSRENRFNTFAIPTITGEIRRHFRDHCWAVRVPRRLQEACARAKRAAEQLFQELGRQPSVSEIAEHVGLEPDQVLEALEVSPARYPLSLDATLRGRNDEEGLELGECLGQVDENLEQVETKALLEQAMAHLTPREREIMTMRFFDELPQTEVAKRLGISQMQVSRLQRAALERMRRDLAAVMEEGRAEERESGTLGDCPPPAQVHDNGRCTDLPLAPTMLRQLPVDSLIPRADQPRHTIDPDSLTELADSIRQWGILQPIRVRDCGGQRYEIIAGERRWSAARQLGMREVPALIVEADDDRAFIESLTENIQREDLNPIERARALKRLRLTLRLQSWEEVGRVVGITRRHVHYLLNATRLPAEMQREVAVGDLTEKHVRALSLLRALPEEQTRLWRRISAEALSGESALELARALRDAAAEVPRSVARARAATRALTTFLSAAAPSEVAALAEELEMLQQQLSEVVVPDRQRGGTSAMSKRGRRPAHSPSSVGTERTPPLHLGRYVHAVHEDHATPRTGSRPRRQGGRLIGSHRRCA